MNHVPVASRYVLALLVLAALTGLLSCSHGGGATAPAVEPELTADGAAPGSPTGEGFTLGYFQFVFGDDWTVQVEEADPPRGAEFNVSAYASIVIEDFYFNEEQRNWYIVATLKNISPYTGYDVWAVFHTLGNKFVVNQDGYLWALPPIFPVPTRCAFVAYGKNQPERVFPPMFQDTRTIVIHQPEGVPKLAPIGFWIDATGKLRKTPGVEDLKVEPLSDSPDNTDYHLTGYIWDHQSPPSDLTAWADCSKFNGQMYVQMFDDGQHGDDQAGDNIFGTDFSGDPPDGLYVITVYAFDPEGNSGENDARFRHGEGPCDEPVVHLPFETIDRGEQSGIKNPEEMVIDDWYTWKQVWAAHTSGTQPPPPIPPIDFEKHTVIGVWIGDRPTNNHMVDIHDVVYDPCENLVTVHYNYTPNIGCGPLDVVTDPFHIIVLQKIPWPVYFAGKEVDCPKPPPECVEEMPINTLIHGFISAIKDPYEKRITNKEDFHAFWKQHTQYTYPPPPPPEINWNEHDVVAVATGERPTGGFECNIERICWLDGGGIGVFYVERIPGPDCPVPPAFTQPHHWVVIPKLDVPVLFFPRAEVYNCGPPDCQEPLMFWPLDEGPHTGHPAGEFVFKTAQEFHTFWQVHKPDVPPPQVNWTESMVLAMLIGERPTTGYFVETVQVCLNGLSDPVDQWIDVTYVENIPGKNCEVLDILTQPFQIIVVPRFDVPVNFHRLEHVYDCEDCQPLLFTQTADGQHSCAEHGEYGFQYEDAYHEFWWAVNCYDPESGDPPPPLPKDPPPSGDSIIYHSGIQLGTRPSTGYFITFDEVCIKGCDVWVKYTEHIPGPDCEVEWVETKPWAIAAIEFPPVFCYWTWYFVKSEEVYDCPDGDCWDFKTLAGSSMSGGETPGGWFFDNYADYHAYWVTYHEGEPMPEIDWQGGWGGYAVHLGVRPTTGYEVEVFEICPSDDPFGAAVRWIEWIPADDCEVAPVETGPWTLVTMPLVDLPYFDEGFEKVYHCK